MALDLHLSRVRTGGAAMGQDCNYQFGDHEKGVKVAQKIIQQRAPLGIQRTKFVKRCYIRIENGSYISRNGSYISTPALSLIVNRSPKQFVLRAMCLKLSGNSSLL